MDLVVVRHAVAKERASFARAGRPDAERPLSGRGRREFRKGARGLARIAGPVRVLATSPFTRARDTAALLAPALGVAPVPVAALAAGASPRALAAWLGRQRRGPVAIVGHEPDLSRLVAALVAGGAREVVALEKGGACLVSFEGPIRRGAGTLRWLLTARQLRRLAR